MYEEFLAYVLDLVKTLNEFERRHVNDDDTLIPYISGIELKMDDQVVGYVRDEIGGAWSYQSASV